MMVAELDRVDFGRINHPQLSKNQRQRPTAGLIDV